jgi:hypothetical protein
MTKRLYCALCGGAFDSGTYAEHEKTLRHAARLQPLLPHIRYLTLAEWKKEGRSVKGGEESHARNSEGVATFAEYQTEYDLSSKQEGHQHDVC